LSTDKPISESGIRNGAVRNGEAKRRIHRDKKYQNKVELVQHESCFRTRMLGAASVLLSHLIGIDMEDLVNAGKDEDFKFELELNDEEEVNTLNTLNILEEVTNELQE